MRSTGLLEQRCDVKRHLSKKDKQMQLHITFLRQKRPPNFFINRLMMSSIDITGNKAESSIINFLQRLRSRRRGVLICVGHFTPDLWPVLDAH